MSLKRKGENALHGSDDPGDQEKTDHAARPRPNCHPCHRTLPGAGAGTRHTPSSLQRCSAFLLGSTVSARTGVFDGSVAAIGIQRSDVESSTNSRLLVICE